MKRFLPEKVCFVSLLLPLTTVQDQSSERVSQREISIELCTAFHKSFCKLRWDFFFFFGESSGFKSILRGILPNLRLDVVTIRNLWVRYC